LLSFGAESFVLLSKNVEVQIYRTVTLPVVLIGCETWSVTLSEEHKLRVFENRVLREVFGTKAGDEINRLYSIKDRTCLD
jgi:hypothetical protein